jgi:hypothetical protein
MRCSANEELIERYLSGAMSGVEEEDFFARVAVDSNLRNELKAYRIMEDALRKHREGFSTEHSATRRRVVAALGAPVSNVRTPSAGVGRYIAIGLSMLALAAAVVVVGFDNGDETIVAATPRTIDRITRAPVAVDDTVARVATSETPRVVAPQPARSRKASVVERPLKATTRSAASDRVVDTTTDRVAVTPSRALRRDDTIRMRMEIVLPE